MNYRTMVSLIVLVTVFAGCGTRQRQTPHPARSDLPVRKSIDPSALPKASEITQMFATIGQSSLGLGRRGKAEVAPDQYKFVLDALLAAEYDANPAKWEEFGEIEIKAGDSRVLIRLYLDAKSNFVMKVAQRYYNGGKSADLEQALRKTPE